MRFALINGHRLEAQPNLFGLCPICDQPMVAKCGDMKIWHWAHKASRLCDVWWENESVWHREWKAEFPEGWQEIVHRAEDGELHIADVKTPDGWVLEIQHSNLCREEREAREVFYRRMTWVVDGTRRRNDLAKFSRAWASGEARDPNSNKRRLSSPVGALLRDWAGSRAHVFFDFGRTWPIWWPFPGSDKTRAYVQYISRAEFIRIHREKGLSEFNSRVQNFIAFIAHYESPPSVARPQPSMELSPEPNRRLVMQRRFRF
jgi:hypothetical protein